MENPLTNSTTSGTNITILYNGDGTGRFLTRDSFAGNVFDPPSLHRYTYVRNDVANRTDPSGNFDLLVGS